jgi:hypothetical protein
VSVPAAQPWRAWLRAWWLLPALAVVFPLLRLLPLDGHFGTDWYNHKWLAAYAGEYLRQHGSVSVVVSSPTQVGMPFPVFYGTLFYPLLAILTTWINPSVALRLVVLLVMGMQFWLISSALARVSVKPWFARGVACLVIWAIYPLSNLYNRSAITEYIATALLTCVVACWFLLVHEPEARARRRIALGFGLLFALTAGVHPITALYSLPILALLLLAAYDEHGRAAAFWIDLTRALALPVGLTVVVLAPWIYALASFKKYLRISETAGTPWFYPDSIDRWATRFYPIPYDIRTENADFTKVETPFLDAQINWALLILLLGWLACFAWRNRRATLSGVRAIVAGLCAFAFFTILSLSPSIYDLLPSFARLLQIAYRAITYQNLSLLLGIFMLAGFVRRQTRAAPPGKSLTVVMIGCLLLSGAGVVMKLQRASKIMHLEGSSSLRTTRSERHSWTTMPVQFYGSADYATPSLYRSVTDDERATSVAAQLPIGTGDDFGTPQPLHLNLPKDTWIKTNVQSFPWNHLVLDGTVVPNDELRVYLVDLYVLVPAGEHTIEMQTTPDPIWLVLRDVSFAVLALWCGWLAYLTIRARRDARRVTVAA